MVATLHFTDETDVPVSTVFRFLIKPVSGVLHIPNNPQYFGVVSWPLFVTFLENLFLFMFMIWALIQDIEKVDCSTGFIVSFQRSLKRKKSSRTMKDLKQFLENCSCLKFEYQNNPQHPSAPHYLLLYSMDVTMATRSGGQVWVMSGIYVFTRGKMP